MTINLSKKALDGNYAFYLPAISSFYVKHLGKALANPDFVPAERLPATMEHGLQGTDFLKTKDSYYHYGTALYSAGHAELRLDKCNDKEPMIHRRDRENTVIIGDSGGFQIATGVIKLDWSTVKGPEGDTLRETILRYLEYTADWSMTLDVPAFSAEPPLSTKTGLTKFEDTLDVTVHNLHYFIKNRVVGKTKFLNVLSGSSPENSKTWYDEVKKFSQSSGVVEMGYDADRTFEGWAFAGINMMHMPSVLNRLLDLIDDRLVEGKDWIHFLGIGRLDWACYLTSIMRQLQKRYNPNLRISFDAASPFVAAGGYALSYNYNHFDSKRLTYAMGRGIDDKSLKNSKMGMVYQSPINDRLSVGDICVYGPNDVNRNGKIGKTSWDTTSYHLIMAHNVYNHIQAVQETLRLADIEYARIGNKVSYTDWSRSKKKTKLTEFVPSSIIFFNDFVEQLFSMPTDAARDLIRENRNFLESISFGGTNNQTRSKEQLNKFFDWSAVNHVEIDEDEIASSQTIETDKILTKLDKLQK